MNIDYSSFCATVPKMRVLVVILLYVVGARGWDGTEEGWIGWHQKFGVVDAERIRRSEMIQSLSPIVGGAIAPINAHPYLVGIVIDVIGLTGPSACGGSLLSHTRVITAAHCYYDGRNRAKKFTIVLGSPFLFHGGLRLEASGIAVHNQYNPRRLSNDIAMIRLPVTVPFTYAIRPVTLPPREFLNMNMTGIWVKASGYGRYSDLTMPTMNTMVRHIFLQTIPLEHCRAVYGDIVKDSNICTSGAGGVGICRGDSGGPLTLNWRGHDVLIGVSSFVAQDGCELGFPSAFAQVTAFMDWIMMLL